MDCWVLRAVQALGCCSMLYPSLCGAAPCVESTDTAGCFELRIAVFLEIRKGSFGFAR